MSRLSSWDPHSFSCPENCIVKTIHICLDVNFDKKILAGFVNLTIERRFDQADSVILDTRDLKINEVKHVESNKNLPFILEEPVPNFGSKLEIFLPKDGNSNIFTISVHYETSSNASALQWLTPEQTSGKKHPYLFSQCQAIHARSILPCQDTPSVKMPYTAEITAPASLVVVMSAIKQPEVIPTENKLKAKHIFKQDVPIPSYLIAIAVGDLVCKEIGPRSKVWSEIETVGKAAYEFAETETFITVGEKLLGPYIWGIYDLLVLPPSFPYGGMENPCLTFVTPTLLAGDRSLANVIVHEISHSWTGNLVTNKNSEHLWLNEGHTVFIERKIISRLYGEKMRHFHSIGGWKELEYAIETLGEASPLTHLVPDLSSIDPDDAFSLVPYEKGHTLLFYLEEKLGGPEVFEPFLRSYVEKFKYKSLTTEEWKNFLYEYFKSKDKTDILNTVDWNAWFNTSGMPPVKPKYDTSLQDVCVNLVQKWLKSDIESISQFSKSDIDNMNSRQVEEFLALLLQKDPLSLIKIQAMEQIYKLNDCHNSEIRFRWLRLCLRAKWEDAIPIAIDFAMSQGRMKFTRPIVRDLYAWEKSRNLIIDAYKKNEKYMHCITASCVAKDLNLIENK